MILLLLLIILKMVLSADIHINIENNVRNVNTKNYNSNSPNKKYSSTWKDLDSRPLPEWYDRAKIGIFVHWGVYSVPSFQTELFWKRWADGNETISNFMKNNYPPGFTYQEFAPMLTAEFFNPDNWASLFYESGAKYVVLTTKHHEGYTLYPSERSFSWNSVDVGPKRDLVGDLASAVRRKGLKFGAYHSLYEWFNPIYLADRKTSFSSRVYPEIKLWPDIKQLVYDYQPSVIWSDGDWEAYDTYWNSTDLIAWLYNDSPVKDEIVVNDRWGIGTYCLHGDFYNCADRYNPSKLQDHKWENAFTLDRRSWGFRRDMNLSDVYTTSQLFLEVVSTVSCGGNALINVGPTKEGTIPLVFEERLLALGKWLRINGEAIYGTSPWFYQNDTTNPNVWYTCTKTPYNARQPTAVPSNSDMIIAVYAIVLEWPETNVLVLGDMATYLNAGTYKVQLLGHNALLNWKIINRKVYIQLPSKMAVASENAWTIKFTR